jgi:hypothetical protein
VSKNTIRCGLHFHKPIEGLFKPQYDRIPNKSGNGGGFPFWRSCLDISAHRLRLFAAAFKTQSSYNVTKNKQEIAPLFFSLLYPKNHIGTEVYAQHAA